MTDAGTWHRGGSGEPLVLIHGFSGTRHHWQPILDPLEDSHDVLAVTLAGHVGGAEIPSGTIVSLDALIGQVERDMDEAGLQTAHLVGNSLGGWISLELARRGRARSVVALSPAGGWEQGTRTEARLRRLFTRNHKMSTRVLPHLGLFVARPRLRRAFLAQAMARGDRLSASAAAQFVRDSAACPVYFDLMDAILRDGPPRTLEGIPCPVLLAWGTKDRILPAGRYSQRLRDLMPAAEWVELPKLGHIPMADDPELVARTIVQFAARAPQPAAVSV
jgi:pimeloyl-ACP methyl ester carboxylesterase